MKLAALNPKNIYEELMAFARNISIGDNFSGQVVKDVILPVGQSVEISHNLKVTPKYRIILRQGDNSIIADGDTPWTDKAIYLKNMGLSDDTLTILIMRD